MKVEVYAAIPDAYRIRLRQGVQWFHLDYDGDHEECRWYAKMFRRALRAHDKERKEREANAKR